MSFKKFFRWFKKQKYLVNYVDYLETKLGKQVNINASKIMELNQYKNYAIFINVRKRSEVEDYVRELEEIKKFMVWSPPKLVLFNKNVKIKEI